MKKRILITGGAGFIGCNAAASFAGDGWSVTILDNFSRPTSQKNVEWLKQNYSVQCVTLGLGDREGLRKIMREGKYDAALHLAAQVAVTTSVENPEEDFEINARGTFNLLEAVRKESPATFFIYTSTNKVYGGMEHVKIVERNGRYAYQDLSQGVDENQALDFHSPYGCSKGAADQYTIDYARIYGLKTIVFRQSCIYGPHQFGKEDQGWIAWFIIAATLGKPITIYGDGKQVRDVLFVDDLVRLYKTAIENQKKCSGQAYNIGGGPENTLSLLELVDLLNSEFGYKIAPKFDKARPGDQRVYISCLDKVKKDLGWQPQISTRDGLSRLVHWVRENQTLFITHMAIQSQ